MVNSKLFDGIVIFTQVIQNGSFSATAEKTGHSTSHISKTITKLEARLGLRLINRTTRSIGLTPEGKVFYQQCEQMIEDATQALEGLNLGNSKPKGLLKVSCPVAFGETYLQPILSNYLSQYPDVKLELDFNDRKVNVIEDGFDLAIRATNQLAESSLICRKIHTSKAYVVASKAYLKRFGRPRSPQDLINHQCICYSNLKAPNRWEFVDTNNNKSQVDVEQTILCNSSQVELQMVLDGHGICRLPAFCMEAELARDNLEILFADYVTPEINVYVIYPSKKHLSPKVRSFIDLLVAQLPD
ncbi:LysR family transcriptional regulator [Thalassomonas sp. M1454]|uniref:LysR family transcriptional regulator n=1 Tax=Thalassomonas sp. M1454 TaxID=2594477 RepID=UPI001180DDF5|nr:LysR family transcriptional regulator [Thalassomonas sp. M1454]TRX57838.1 LysR family transcriptional regulator [Thalassomonas sp. M1454]